MKTFLKFFVFASLNFICWMHAGQAHADSPNPQINGLFIRSYGHLFSWTLIWPKSTEKHTDYSYDHGMILITIDENNFDEIAIFLQNQRSKWSPCDHGKGWPDGDIIGVRWIFAKEEGDYCVTSNEAIPLFDELSRISFSSGNNEFSSLMIKTRNSLNQVKK